MKDSPQRGVLDRNDKAQNLRNNFITEILGDEALIMLILDKRKAWI